MVFLFTHMLPRTEWWTLRWRIIVSTFAFSVATNIIPTLPLVKHQKNASTVCLVKDCVLTLEITFIKIAATQSCICSRKCRITQRNGARSHFCREKGGRREDAWEWRGHQRWLVKCPEKGGHTTRTMTEASVFGTRESICLPQHSPGCCLTHLSLCAASKPHPQSLPSHLSLSSFSYISHPGSSVDVYLGICGHISIFFFVHTCICVCLSIHGIFLNVSTFMCLCICIYIWQTEYVNTSAAGGRVWLWLQADTQSVVAESFLSPFPGPLFR